MTEFLVDILAMAEEKYGSEIASMLRERYRPGFHCEVPPRLGREGVSGCWFGGRPTLPAEIDWPVFTRPNASMPMHFLAQFDCAKIPRLEGSLLPACGTLMFFFEPHLNQDRYLDPEEEFLGGRVIYIKDASGVPLRDPPLRPNVDPEAFFKEKSGVLKTEVGEFLENRFDPVYWNEEYRGTPPMLGGPRPVELIPMQGFDDLSRAERQNLNGDMKKKYYSALVDAGNFSDIVFHNGNRIGHILMSGMTEIQISDSNERIFNEYQNIFTYQIQIFHHSYGGDNGFIARYYIKTSDLQDVEFSNAFTTEAQMSSFVFKRSSGALGSGPIDVLRYL